MSWRHGAAEKIQARSDSLIDAITVAISAEFDLPAVEVRAELVRLTQPTVDQIIAELMAGRTDPLTPFSEDDRLNRQPPVKQTADPHLSENAAPMETPKAAAPALADSCSVILSEDAGHLLLEDGSSIALERSRNAR